jgi:hypothetical protein
MAPAAAKAWRDGEEDHGATGGHVTDEEYRVAPADHERQLLAGQLPCA